MGISRKLEVEFDLEPSLTKMTERELVNSIRYVIERLVSNPGEIDMIRPGTLVVRQVENL